MTKNLKLDEKTARNLYSTATKDFKAILEDTWGKEFFNQKITNRIHTFEDILNIAGISYSEILPWASPVNKKQRSQNALAKIQLISEVYNEGSVLDWENKNQSKYYPYFEKKAGSRWVLYGVFDCRWSALCPFGCYFKDKTHVEDAVNKFMDIFIDYLPE